MPSLLKARDNILAADGVKPDVENAVQWMSLTMMKLKQILISTEDSSKQLNLQLLNVFEKSMKALKQKSLNNIQKSAHHCQPVIFDMLHSDVCDRELQDVEEEQETCPAKQEPLDEAVAKEEAPHDDDKTEASKSIFDLPDQLALEDKKLLRKEFVTEPQEDLEKDFDGNEVTAMKPVQDFIGNSTEPLQEVIEKSSAAVPEFPPTKCAQ